MKIIKAGYQIMSPNLDDPEERKSIYKRIEAAGRTCYKSEDRIKEDSAGKFVRAMVKNGHEAMLEHVSMTVRFIVDRGVSHELVRHRICSFAQESTRFCSYDKDKFGSEVTFIEPGFFSDLPEEVRQDIRNLKNGMPMLSYTGRLSDRCLQYGRWYDACRYAEGCYFDMLKLGASPQEARAVLPNSLKTEVVMTADMREWRNIFKLRAAGEHGAPHPQMLELMVPLLKECKEKLPELFDDIGVIDNEN